MKHLYLMCASAAIALMVGSSVASATEHLFQNLVTQLVHLPN